MTAMRSREGDLLDPLDPVGVQRPAGHSGAEGFFGADETTRAEARVVWLRANRCKPRSRGLWSGYHCEKDKELQRAYGFGCDYFWKLFVEQAEVCGVCGNPPGVGLLVVDEDEDTREIRGLCHRGCNGKITPGVARYVLDPPARRVGVHVVSPERFAKRQRRLANKRKARRAAKAATAQASPAPVGDYAANLAALRKGRGKA